MKKTYFISIAVIALLAVFTLSSFIVTSPQETDPATESGYILVRTAEIYGMNPSSMITIYEDGTVEKVPLLKLNAKTMEENLLTIHTKLNEIKNKGYKLVSTTGGNSDNIICTTYLFEKE